MPNNKFQILVIEDDEVDRIQIEKAITQSKITNPITFAPNAIAALEMLNKKEIGRPLLILLDINMPKMNGLDFLQELRNIKEWALTPVIMMTSSNSEVDKLKSYQLGVVGYIVKPLDLTSFLNITTALNAFWTLSEFPPENKS